MHVDDSKSMQPGMYNQSVAYTQLPDLYASEQQEEDSDNDLDPDEFAVDPRTNRGERFNMREDKLLCDA